MRTARILLPLLVLGGAAAGLATWQPWSGDDAIVDPSQDRAIAEVVGIRTLTEEITIRGELRRDELQTVNSAGDGRISELVIENGDTIRAGDVLYALDGRRVVAVNGDFAFYRQLDVGSDGPDVLQLETILVEAGYPVGDVDRLFTEETRSGLAAWQADRGYGAATPEVDEVVTVSLMGNPAGYSIGAVNTVAVLIVQAPSGSAGVQGRQVAATAAGGTPTVTVSVVDVIITEGDSVTFTISADPVPTTDLEVLVSIGGDVTVDDDYESIQKTVVIAAGTATVDLVVTTLVDDDREPNEDLEVTITGLFDDVGSLAPQDLVVFDLQEEITTLLGRRDELVAEIAEAAAAPQLLRAFDLRVEIEGLLERRDELVDEIAEAQQDLAESEAEVSGLESRQREKTNVEQELIDKGIITIAQAIASDLTPAEAAQWADVLMILIPDEKQAVLYANEIEPHLRAGQHVMFGHGFNVHYNLIRPRPDVDVSLSAPKGPGHTLRAQYQMGFGLPGLIAIHQDATGTAQDVALSYSKAIGNTRAGVIETSFREETETDLFGEQVVLCGGVAELVKSAYETLVEAGYQPESAYFECMHELKLIVDLFYQGGLEYMRYSVSDTAEFGDYTRGPRIIDDNVRENMKKVLAEIQDGSFAREWIAENDEGRPTFNRLREENAGHPIEAIGKELRGMMTFLSDTD